MATSEAECLKALHEAADILGEPPTKSQYEALDVTPSSTTIRRIIGGWNEAKSRAGLKTDTQDESGGRKVASKPDDIELPEARDWEALTAQQRWYYKNRQYRIHIKEARRERLREWLSEFKCEEVECIRCTEDRPITLDFHHPDDKHQGVSQMVNRGYSKERVREEIERCVPLCANCHRKEHHDRVEPAVLPDISTIEKRTRHADSGELREMRRAWVLAYKREQGGCQRCSVANPVCLDFHHKAEKTLEVSNMVSQGWPLEKIRREITSCELLCANCHRIEHESTSDAGVETDSV